MEFGLRNGMMHFKNAILGIGAVALVIAAAQSHAACAPDKVSQKYPGYAGRAVVVCFPSVGIADKARIECRTRGFASPFCFHQS